MNNRNGTVELTFSPPQNKRKERKNGELEKEGEGEGEGREEETNAVMNGEGGGEGGGRGRREEEVVDDMGFGRTKEGGLLVVGLRGKGGKGRDAGKVRADSEKGRSS